MQDAEDIKSLLTSVPNFIQIKLVDLMNPDAARKVLPHIPFQNQAMCLVNISERQRLLIVKKFSKRRESEVLNQIQDYQELEMRNWPGNISESTVMTGTLPDHYPSTMNICSTCKKGYKKWQSVWVTDCLIHSCHEGCIVNCGTCPLGENCKRARKPRVLA